MEVEKTPFGVRGARVQLGWGDKRVYSVTEFVLPNLGIFSNGTVNIGEDEVAYEHPGYTVNWHVPIDDTHHWRYMIRFSRSAPMDQNRSGRSPEIAADYRLERNRANRYLQDREEMRGRSFSGLGRNFLPHDTWATEGEGPIQDRTQEHLGATDRGIVAARMLLLRAIRDVQAGREAPTVVRQGDRQPPPNLVVRSDVLLPSTVDWHRYWEQEAIELQLVGAGSA
jgi:hypothetical protein